ncbi:MAG TPA: ABC transporter permease [Polyangiaceae bacterium]|nr:ABC transporter permease [Polyangiaceae bacterium]
MSGARPSALGAQLDLLAFALGALGRRGGRTWALVGGLASAMALLSAVVFLTEALRAEAARARANAPDLVVQRLVGGRPALVDVASAEALRPLPGVASVRPRVWGYLFLASLQGNVTIVGGSGAPAAGAPGGAPPADGGAALAQGVMLRGPGECVLGLRLAEALGVRVGDKVAFPAAGGDEHGPGTALRVVGLFSSPVALWTSDVALVHDDDARTLLGVPPGAATDLALALTNPDESAVVAKKTLLALPGARVLERRLLERVHTLSYGRRAGFVLGASLPALLALLALAWDRLSGLGPAERREIAVLKAAGWSTADVVAEKLYEALLVGAGAGALGLVAGYLWAFALGAPGLREVLAGWSVLYPDTRLTPAVDAAQLFGLLALVTAPYLALSVGPAWRAATLDPLEAMRQG